jgi:spore coat protein A, manganese oxidase
MARSAAIPRSGLSSTAPRSARPERGRLEDTFKILPGMVNRVLVRWAPTETAVDGVQPGQNLFQFDPTVGRSYVWHCHILDHEDTEMMRPYIPVK